MALVEEITETNLEGYLLGNWSGEKGIFEFNSKGAYKKGCKLEGQFLL